MSLKSTPGPSSSNSTQRPESPSVGMLVRMLDEDGAEIASFDGNQSVQQNGLPDEVRDAFLAFREEYPELGFIGVEFSRTDQSDDATSS